MLNLARLLLRLPLGVDRLALGRDLLRGALLGRVLFVDGTVVRSVIGSGGIRVEVVVKEIVFGLDLLVQSRDVVDVGDVGDVGVIVDIDIDIDVVIALGTGTGTGVIVGAGVAVDEDFPVLDVVLFDVLDDSARQLRVTLGRVGLAVLVEGHRPAEPLRGRPLVTRRGQRVGVSEGEAGRPGLGTGVTQLGKALEGDDRGVVLAEVSPGAGLHDGEFDLADAVEPLGLLGTDQVKRTFGAAKTALAVRHDRQERVGTCHPASRAQIAERLGEVTGAVGRDTDGLTDHSDPGREAACDLRVLVGPLRVVLAKSPLGRHEMTGDQIREVERKRTQLFADLLVELLRGDVRRELGQLLTLAAGSLVAPPEPVVPAIASAGTLTVAVAVPEGRTTARTVVPVERPALTAVIAVERRTVTTAIVAVERGTIPAIPAARTVITVERPALTIRPRTVAATSLVAITVRTTLATTIITAGRRPIITVERRTIPPAAVTVERRSIAAIPTPRPVVPVERPALTAVIAVERRTATTAIVAVEGGTATTGAIVAVERGTIPAIATARTVVPVERPALTTIGTRTVLTTRLVTVTVRTTLATTIITAGRRPIITVERPTLATAIVAVERGTVTTAVVAVRRRPIAAIPTTRTITVRTTLATAVIAVEGGTATTGAIVAVERGTIPAIATARTVITVERPALTTIGTRTVLTTRLVTVTVRTTLATTIITAGRRPIITVERPTLATAIIAVEGGTATTTAIVAVERGTIPAIATARTVITVERPALTTAIIAVERRTTGTAVVTVVGRPVATITRAVGATARLAVTIRTLALAARP
ncbi:hypothetical protein [Streptosporangium sp. NPDC006930]|uniref:hypothetical protein n=1 Tax=Streptosporangium sp. NPDC006930 TaxID=3154783 RepID=UPI00343C8A4E